MALEMIQKIFEGEHFRFPFHPVDKVANKEVAKVGPQPAKNESPRKGIGRTDESPFKCDAISEKILT